MKHQTSSHILSTKLHGNLRNASTDAKRALWQRLKARQIEGCKFRRLSSQRTRFLEAAGFIVSRFWNNDVFSDIEGALQVIHRALAGLASPSPPNLPLEGES